MKKYKVGIIIAILFLTGVFSVSISTGNFFFTTKYFKTPIDAYNDSATINAIHGDTKAKKELGLLLLDNETCLFVGELYDNRFVVDEMKIKNDRYASKGMSFFYNLGKSIDGIDSNMTNTSDGYVKWGVTFSKQEAEKLTDVASIESYTCSNGYDIYLVVYKN